MVLLTIYNTRNNGDNMSLPAKFQDIRNEMNVKILERDEQIRGLILAMLTKESIVILGAPGTGKTFAIAELTSRITDANMFEVLMSPFTSIEEVMGPVSIQKLQQDKYERCTAGYLPSCHVGYLDEIFKASSAILNCLLDILAMRRFKQGTQNIQVPLISMIGSSNETPTEDNLLAFFDRFSLRYIANYISPANVTNLLRLNTNDKPVKRTCISFDELKQAQKEVQTVTIPEPILEEVANMKAILGQSGYIASDRRWKTSMKLLQACAYLEGRDSVVSDDLFIYGNMLWDEMKDAKPIADAVGKIINPEMQKLLENVDAIEKLINEFINAQDEQTRISSKMKINTHQANIKKLNVGKKGIEAAAQVDEKVKAAVKKILGL